MSQHHPYFGQHHGSPHRHHYRQHPYPPAPQALQGPAHWPAYCAPRAPHPTAPAVGGQPLFRVRITKHTGLVFLTLNQRYTYTGTFAQCEAELRGALLHNLLAGWWSMFSVILLNWIALAENHNARKALRRQAAQTTLAPTPQAPPAPPTPWNAT